MLAVLVWDPVDGTVQGAGWNGVLSLHEESASADTLVSPF